MNWEVRTMQSRTSFFNGTLFRRNLTRFWPLWGGASFLGSLFPLAISNLGLTTIISFSLPVLMFLYPLSITLILLSLLGGLFGRDRRVFVSVTVLTLAAALLDFLAALPKGAKSILHLEGLLGWANSYIPLFSYGLGWLLPAALGLMIGLALRWRASR